nr:Peptidoglycan N-acetylglucosamine deacetylase [Streptococcus thermophilus]
MKRSLLAVLVAAVWVAPLTAPAVPAVADASSAEPSLTFNAETLQIPSMSVVPEPSDAAMPKLEIPSADCSDCVAVTFDDGPSDETVRLLNILRDMDAKASFFVIGTSAELRPGVLRRMLNDKHTIANHSRNHPPLSTLADAGIMNELDVTTRDIKSAVYWGPRWLRPPYGDMDARVASIAGNRGLALAMWDVDTNDWQHHNAATSCNIAVGEAQPGSIILLHDIHPESVDAVPCIIDGLRAKGLRPVSLDEMIPKPAAGMTYTNKFTPAS